jgi:serine/threonine protein kinase
VKACPACGRLFPVEASFCPVDATELRSATQVPVQANDDERVGSLIAMRYQVRRVVADGGMGRVYEALDLQERRQVALKILHTDVAADHVSVERFKREFEVSKQLPHDHIVEVLDFCSDGGIYALVMEFLEGEELRTTLKREKIITPGRTVRMVSQIALGLAPAHAKQLIHRDLKPDNIFLCGTRDGDCVKILDFGSVRDNSTGAKKLTMLGTTIGSPYYMSPEQAEGRDSLDHRADVWAIAAIVYESVTGQVPFAGSNGPAILLQIMNRQPTPPSIAGVDAPIRVPPTLDEVIDDALAKDPFARVPSLRDLAARIGEAYGLTGDVETWANTAQHTLDDEIAKVLPTLQTKHVKAAEVVDDPFASPKLSEEQEGKMAMDAAFNQQGSFRYEVDPAMAGIPKATPPWLIPVIIGVVFLIVGIGIALAIVM